jgi:hypothetical protein
LQAPANQPANTKNVADKSPSGETGVFTLKQLFERTNQKRFFGDFPHFFPTHRGLLQPTFRPIQNHESLTQKHFSGASW